MSCRLIARTGVFVRTTSDFVTYEALIVSHVLRTLGRGESEGIYVHGIGVTMRGRGRPVSSRRDISVASGTQLLESLGDIVKLTSFRQPVLVSLRLIFQRCHLEGQVSRHCLP